MGVNADVVISLRSRSVPPWPGRRHPHFDPAAKHRPAHG
jgi:hypothetical protein